MRTSIGQNVKTPFSREFSQREVQGAGYEKLALRTRTDSRVPTPPSGTWSTVVSILLGGKGGKCDRLGLWPGKRTRQCRQKRHQARPSPTVHDWVLKSLTRLASSSAPHVQGGLLSFPFSREEAMAAMAAMASFGALALLLLSSLSCCSGSGLTGPYFGRTSVPWQVVLGEEGCARGWGLALPGALRCWDLTPLGIVSWRAKHHIHVYLPARRLEEQILPCLLLGEPKRRIMLWPSVPAGKVIYP